MPSGAQCTHNRVCAVLCVRMAHSDASTPHTHTYAPILLGFSGFRPFTRSFVLSVLSGTVLVCVDVCRFLYVPFGLAYALRAALHGFIFHRLCAFYLYLRFFGFFFRLSSVVFVVRVCTDASERCTLSEWDACRGGQPYRWSASRISGIKVLASND